MNIEDFQKCLKEQKRKDQEIQNLKGYLKKTPISVDHMLEYLDTLLIYMDLHDKREEYEWECITLGHLNMLSYIANNAYGKKYFLDVFEIGDEDYLGISYEKVKKYIKSIKNYIKDWKKEE